VTIAEGEPVRVASLDFSGFEVIPADHLEEMKKKVPLKVGQPRDRQLVVATHDLAVNELKDHGYPYGKVTTNEENAETRQGVAGLRRRARQDRAFRARSRSSATRASTKTSSAAS
jgi:outer membrane protein assembly factor BamA